jgi:hypothetical protein
MFANDCILSAPALGVENGIFQIISDTNFMRDWPPWRNTQNILLISPLPKNMYSFMVPLPLKSLFYAVAVHKLLPTVFICLHERILETFWDWDKGTLQEAYTNAFRTM